MGKRFKKLVGLVVSMAAVGCGAAPEETGNPEEQAESENVGTSSEALPKCEEYGTCGGGEYTPPEDYPFDNECGTGESRWNSANGCGPNDVCAAGITGCRPPVYGIRRCSSLTACGPSNSPSTNPCYSGYVGMACALAGGYTGHCGYDVWGVLACFD